MNQLRKRSHQRFLQAGLVLTSGVLPLLIAGCGGSNNPGSRATAATVSPSTGGGQCPGNLDNTPFLGAYTGRYFINSEELQNATSPLVLARDGVLRLTVNASGAVQGTLGEDTTSAATVGTVAGTATFGTGNVASFTATGTLPGDSGGTATVEVRGQYRIDACIPQVSGDITVTNQGVSRVYYFQLYTERAGTNNG